MRSTFGGLNTALRGMAAQQISLDTVGHNISNSSTAGYSRQSVSLVSTTPETIYGEYGALKLGSGVDVQTITRARDSLVDKQMWRESSYLGYSNSMSTNLSKIEQIMDDPSDTGVQSVMDGFWDSWQELSTNPADTSVRTQVSQRGQELVDALQTAAKQLKSAVADINNTVSMRVDSINQISSEIASLNQQISLAETGQATHANDLRDKRDSLVDQLSSYTTVSVAEDEYGNYNIMSAGIPLVNGRDYEKLATKTTMDADYGYDVTNVVLASNGDQVVFASGEMKALLDSRDSTSTGMKGYLNNISSVCQFFQQDFNEVHRSGYGLDDSTNHNFFGGDNILGGTTLYQQSSTDIHSAFAVPGVTFASGDTLKLTDETGNVMNIDMAAMASAPPATSMPMNNANLDAFMAKLVDYVNTTAESQSPQFNGRAMYDSTTGKLALYGSGSGSTVTLSDGSATASTNIKAFITNLQMADPKPEYWLENMQMNPGITASVDGLNEIAAKKTDGTQGIDVTQSNSNGGTLTSTGTYTGTQPLKIRVESLSGTSVSQVEYSTDGGATYLSTAVSAGPYPAMFTINVAGINASLQLNNSAGNDVGDTYDVVVPASGHSASIMTGGTPVMSTSGTYTGGTTATTVKTKITADASGRVTGLQYSTDGGTTYITAPDPTGGNGPYPTTYAFTVNGVTVNMQIPTIAGNTTGDIYTFKLSANNGIPVSNVQQNSSYGLVTSHTGTGTMTTFGTTGNYTGGTSASAVNVEVLSIDGSGNATSIRYQTNGGAWSSALTGTGTYSVTVNGITMNLPLGAGNGVGDTYGLSVGKNANIAEITSTVGTYTGGTDTTAVKLKVLAVDANHNITQIAYSTDSGNSWTNVADPTSGVGPYPGTFSYTIKGVTVNMKLNSVSTNQVGDIYNFNLSQSNTAAGDNAVLLGNRMKVDTSALLGNASLDGYYTAMIGQLGVQSQDSQRLQENQQTLVDQITNTRESVSGVNYDEELTNMIQFQKGYNAAARVVTTIDEMLDKLINSTGQVGR